MDVFEKLRSGEPVSMSLMEELFAPNSYQQHYSYPVIVTPSQNGHILNTVDFEGLFVEADNIQYGIGCIQSAIYQRKLCSVLPKPTPASELALTPSDFVVMATV